MVSVQGWEECSTTNFHWLKLLRVWKSLTHSKLVHPLFCFSAVFLCAMIENRVLDVLLLFLQYANLININCAVSRSQKRTEWQRQLKFKCSLHFFCIFFVTWRQAEILHYMQKCRCLVTTFERFVVFLFFGGSCGFSMHRCTMQWIKQHHQQLILNGKELWKLNENESTCADFLV